VATTKLTRPPTHDHTGVSGRLGLAGRLAAWALTHRARVVAMWVVLLVGAMAASRGVAPHYVNNLALSGTDSQRATDLLDHNFPTRAGDVDQIVFHSSSALVTDRTPKARLAPILLRVSHLPHVSTVVSPFSPAGARGISADRRTAFATVVFDQRADVLPHAAVNRVIALARSAGTRSLQVELGGRAVQDANPPSLGAATAIGVVAAIIILLITFGSVIAMGLPILTALLGLGSALGLIGLGSRVLDTPDFSTELAALLGLGVGIDYALFIVTRFRENYSIAGDVPSSIIGAMDTAGRAVLFAGATVIIALLGMFAIGVSLLNAAALATALSVGLTMLAALTILPVLISRFGERIGSHKRSRRATGAQAPTKAGFWPRWAGLVTHHPWPALIAGLSIMLVLLVPAFSLRLGQSDAGNDPTSLTSRRAYDLVAQGFGKGFNGPLQVVAQLQHPRDQAALARVGTTLQATPGVASVSAPELSPSGQTAVYQVLPRTAPQSQATTQLVNRLRDQELSPVKSATGATVVVGGSTATGIDFSHVIAGKLALFIGVVVLLAGLLLAMAFRSIAIPIQAAVMNLLSVGASLGVVVAIFQYGWLGGSFNVTAGPIEPFIPVIVFAIVFGLSMDYEVFLISRIHEAWTRRRDPTAAVIDGLGSTGRVVTAAATIMVCIFISFVLGDQRVIKLFGVSLASAVFLDAFVVRSLLLPSVLTLLGKRTWAFPEFIDRRLPRITIERPQGPPIPALTVGNDGS
jgi:putative drug exporter of the RND superfamily